MNLPPKSQWNVSASDGNPAAAVDAAYSARWAFRASPSPWLEIDLGRPVALAGLEIYWGRHAPRAYAVSGSLDRAAWFPLCATANGEGGQDVFAFPPTEARYVRWASSDAESDKILEIVEINLYGPDEAATVLEPGRIGVLGQGPVRLAPGDSITVDLGYVRSPLGVLVQWGADFGTVFSVHLSDDGESFREVGRIEQSHGDYDNFYWRITTARYLRFTLHVASSPDGAIVRELKLRILNKDRMPIGKLERVAAAARADLYPQSLLSRQIYWTVLGEIEQAREALFDEFGNLEPRTEAGQLMPLLRLDGRLHGAPAATEITQTLADGSLPIPTVAWSIGTVEITVTALAEGGCARVEYRVANRGDGPRSGALVLALRPLQINPYWQHGGHAAIDAVVLAGNRLDVNGQPYAAFSRVPDVATVTDFADGDVVSLIEHGPKATAPQLSSTSGLLSAAAEFRFDLAPGESASVVVSAPIRDGVEPDAGGDFKGLRERVATAWRDRIGPRRIRVGDPDVSDTVEAQTGLILVNAARDAFKPGPRNYDRVWIRDGSSQALALLYAGLADDAKRYVLWYAERIYPNGLVPPILNPDGSINTGYGSDIEYDAQGQFVAIAAEVYRFTRDRAFLAAVYEPVVRATRFIEKLVARTNAQHGPETRFHGLVAPSISHEGYNKPTYSYWDDFFALKAWRDCVFLAEEMGDEAMAAEARTKGEGFAADLARSMRMTAEARGLGLVPASAERDDVDQTSTSAAFEPCRVEDVLPAECLAKTYDLYMEHLDLIAAPGFTGGFTPYEIRNLNALVALGRYEDSFRLLRDALTWRRPPGWRHWAEVVWADLRVADYLGDMPHTWIGAEFATAIRRMLVREDGGTLELLRAVPENWWEGDGIVLTDLPTAFGCLNLKARREGARVTVEMALAGTAPDRVMLRCPGVRRAEADGRLCALQGDWIAAPCFAQLEIGF